MFSFGGRFGISKPQRGAMVPLENLKMNKVDDIILSADAFIALLNAVLKSYKFPKEVLTAICNYAQTAGGKRNFNSGEYNNMKIHTAVDANDINEVDMLLKEGLYVDQWYEFKTPLFRAVYTHRNIEMAEFLIINGARRRIKSPVYELEKRDDSDEFLNLLRPFVDEDPLLGTWTSRDIQVRALEPGKFGYTPDHKADTYGYELVDGANEISNY